MCKIFFQKIITNAIYDKFIEAGSVHHRVRSGKLSLLAAEKLNEIENFLSDSSMNSVRGVSPQVSMFQSIMHRAMRNVLSYQPYKMH